MKDNGFKLSDGAVQGLSTKLSAHAEKYRIDIAYTTNPYDFSGSVRSDVYDLLKSGGFIDIDQYMLRREELAQNDTTKGMIKSIDKKIAEIEHAIDKAQNKLFLIAANPKKYREERDVRVQKLYSEPRDKQLSDIIQTIIVAAVSLAVAITAFLMKDKIVNEFLFNIVRSVGTGAAAGAIIFPCLALYELKYEVVYERKSKEVIEKQMVSTAHEARDKVTAELRDILKDNVTDLKFQLNEFTKEAGKEVVPLKEDLVFRCSTILDNLEKSGNAAGVVYKVMASLGVDMEAYKQNGIKELTRAINAKYTKPGIDRVGDFLDKVTTRLRETIGDRREVYKDDKYQYAGMIDQCNPSKIYANKNLQQVKEDLPTHFRDQAQKHDDTGKER